MVVRVCSSVKRSGSNRNGEDQNSGIRWLTKGLMTTMEPLPMSKPSNESGSTAERVNAQAGGCSRMLSSTARPVSLSASTASLAPGPARSALPASSAMARAHSGCWHSS